MDYERQVEDVTIAAITEGEDPTGESPEDEDIGELQVAEYIVFLLALDTYLRYLEEVGGEGTIDPLGTKGVRLLRLADSLHVTTIGAFLRENLKTDAQKTMLERALRLHTTAENAARRALMIRTVLSRGGTATMRAVFESQKALQAVRKAIAASMVDDADAALDLFVAIQLRNVRIRNWINEAAKLAGTGLPPGAVTTAGDNADDVHAVLRERVTQQGAPAASEVVAEATNRHETLMAKIQTDAESSAKRSLEVTGQPDTPPTRSEVIGIATAAAVAATTDPAVIRNRPRAFQGPPPADDEQLEAGLSDGKVLVAAGAGAGKSATLVSRIQYLIEDRRVSPSRIMAVTFNTGAADELKKRIDEKMGPGFHQQLAIGTMHSVFRRFIRGGRGTKAFGTPQEAELVSDWNLIQRDGKKGEDKKDAFAVDGEEVGGRKRQKPPKGSHLTYAIKGMWKDCGPEGLAKMTGFSPEIFKVGPEVTAKGCRQFMENWRGNDIDFKTARLGAETMEELYATIWYEMYHGLKGDLGPDWAPCGGNGSRSFATFVEKYREPDNRGRPTKRLGDADDMIRIFRDILRRNPEARQEAQKLFDHICVDEAQDLNEVQIDVFDMMTSHITDDKSNKSYWLVGDDKQCVAAETPISTPGGVVPAASLRTGDKVLALRNGDIVPQTVRHVMSSSWTHGVKITTEGGKTLTMSPNHKIWAALPDIDDDQMVVYLMYRRDKGFRAGITNKCRDENYYTSFGGRTSLERAERLWILDIAPSRDQALYLERSYSLKYGIPTEVFEGENRGLDQHRIDALFNVFGKNGGRLLEEKHLNFDLPHWMSYSYTKHGRLRRTVQLTAHGSKGTQVALEWQGNDLDEALANVSFIKQDNDRRRLRKWFNNYRSALVFAEDVAHKAGANLSQRLSTPEGVLRKVTASGLFAGMAVVVQDSAGSFETDRITTVEEVDGLTFVDLDVDDASNFFGGGILSSNSIYQFRGARPSQFSAKKDSDDFKLRLIQTNYRCEPEIVEAANKISANNTGQIPMQCRAAPSKKEGVASLEVTTPGDYIDGAFEIFNKFESTMSIERKAPDKFAVLSRNNAELNAFEDQCILRGIPYTRSTSKGFLESPETRVVLGYMDLALSSDAQELQKAFVPALSKPDRGIYLAQEDLERIVLDTIKQAAFESNIDSRSFNPLDFLTRPQMARKLATNLKMPFKGKFVQLARRMEGQYGHQRWLQDKMRRDGYDWKFYEAVDELTEQLMEMGNQILAIRQSVRSGMETTKILGSVLDDIKVESGYLNRKSGQDTRKVTSLRKQLREDIAFIRDPEEDGEDDTATKLVVDEKGVHKEEDPAEESIIVEEDPLRGLGAVRYLFQLATPNAKDESLGLDPSKGSDFYRKIDRYKQMSTELQDPNKHKARLTLSTVHSVKGRQWDHVALCMSYGIFPGNRSEKRNLLENLLKTTGTKDPRDSTAHAAAKSKIDSIKEDPMTAERNLAYVGVTRAKQDLFVVCSQERVPPKMKQNGPVVGLFVEEAGLRIGENVSPAAATPAPEAPPENEVKVASWIEDDMDIGRYPEAFEVTADEAPTGYDRRPA